MAYGWQAWKQRSKMQPLGGFSASAKERGYMRGFRDAAKDLGISGEGAICPGHVLDDPCVDAANAYELGQWDARQAAKKRRAVS